MIDEELHERGVGSLGTGPLQELVQTLGEVEEEVEGGLAVSDGPGGIDFSPRR